jgi:type IV pilus assembly protein PilM
LGLLTSDNRVFGLDIGFETIQLCELKKSGNKVSIVGYVAEEIKERILDKDRIKNKAAVATLIKEACHNAKPHPIRAKKIVTALPETFVFSRTIQIPKMTPSELETAVPNEAAQFLPIPLADVYVDYQVLITHPDEPLMDILMAAAPKRLVDDYVEMAKAAGLELSALETKPIAVGRAIIPEKTEIGIAVAHIGTEITRISIWDKGEIRLVTTVAKGKNHILENMTASDPRVKSAEKAKVDENNLSEVTLTMAPIVNELIESIRYHQNRGYKPSAVKEVYLCGSGAVIKGVDKFISDQIKIPAKIAQPKYKTRDSIGPDSITAFGLALREI